MPITAGDPSVDVRLERLQAAVDVGNAQIKGSLDVLMLRHDQSEKINDERDRRVAVELKERDVRLDKLETKVSGLSRQVWVMAGASGALCGSASVLAQVLMHH